MITPRVRLERPLAEGSMATVWVAEHLSLETRVAVKLVSGDGVNEELLARFEREAKAAAQIKSQHVAQIFDYGVSDDGAPYMVLELLDGESLAAHLERLQRLSLEDCNIVVTHVARALSKAHTLGIVHRDIKPANIFLTRSEDGLLVKVLDFGVAKRLHGTTAQGAKLTADGMLVGTPPYMSPEQILYGSARLSSQADLWSLAVVAYRCLTGELPFVGDTLNDLSLAVFRASPARVSAIRPDLPPAVDTFFARAFRKKLDERFDTAANLAEAFAELTHKLSSYHDDAVTVPISRWQTPPSEQE
jgi:serine/threonine protein kinase